MEISSGEISKFKNIKYHAYWTNVHLDTSLTPDANDVKDYKAYLNNRIDNPTVGSLADHKYISGKSHNYPSDFYRNKNTIEADSGVSQLKQVLTNKIQGLYPKSRKIREHIIAGDRLELDYVKKSKGYKLIDKLKILLRK